MYKTLKINQNRILKKKTVKHKTAEMADISPNISEMAFKVNGL